MYYFIKGQLTLKEDGFAVVETGGIGYQIYTSLSTLEALGETGKTVTLYTYLHVREGIMDLYGFATPEEKAMFLHLIGVTGIGPKVALSVLSVTTPPKFAIAVITNDVKTIQKAQGVGAKVAQRIILELKDKLKNADLGMNIQDEGVEFSGQDNRSEALSALIVLGYSDKEATRAIKGLDPDLDTEELIKMALKRMM